MYSIRISRHPCCAMRAPPSAHRSAHTLQTFSALSLTLRCAMAESHTQTQALPLGPPSLAHAVGSTRNTRRSSHAHSPAVCISTSAQRGRGREAGCRRSPSAHAAPVIYYQQQRREHRAVVAHAPSMCAIAYHSQPLPRSDCRMLQSPMRSLLPVRHHLPPNHATQARQYPRLARPVAAPAGHTCERHPLT